MTRMTYFQPVVIHRTEPERLLLTDDASQWYLWLGEHDGEPVRIPETLAWYLVGRPEMQRLEAPRMWFAVDALPCLSYTHLRAHETVLDLVCRLLLEKKKK